MDVMVGPLKFDLLQLVVAIAGCATMIFIAKAVLEQFESDVGARLLIWIPMRLDPIDTKPQVLDMRYIGGLAHGQSISSRMPPRMSVDKTFQAL